MRTIQSRIQHCKNRVPIAAPKIEESAKLQADVDAWLAKGNEIYDADKKEANFSTGVTAGWVCTVAGSPGTWVAMANLA